MHATIKVAKKSANVGSYSNRENVGLQPIFTCKNCTEICNKVTNCKQKEMEKDFIQIGMTGLYPATEAGSHYWFCFVNN